MKFSLLFLVFAASSLLMAQKKAPGLYAEFNTSKGVILCVLEMEKTPMTVANFVGLAEGNFTNGDKSFTKPYYDGLKFHRVIPNFMIQGGCPLGNGSGDPGYKFADEFDPSLKHTCPGILSMANSGPGTNGSQFFITHNATSWLDGKHTVFGHVISGQAVVDSIKQDDLIQSVKIIRVGKAAKKFNPTKIFKEINDLLSKAEAEKKLYYDKVAAMSEEEFKAFMFAEVKNKFPKAQQSASGLVYIIEQEGTDPKPELGSSISLHYNGTLRLDGKKFDSSYDRNAPMDFNFKINKMIPGFEEGIAMLGSGGKAKLIIPYFQAYGKSGRAGVIPPYSDLVFDIEIVKLAPPNNATYPDGQQHDEHDGHKH